MYHNKYLKYKFKYQLLQKKLKGGMKKETVAQFPEFLNFNINIIKLQHRKELDYESVEHKPDFFEEQESSACGRHALNNLFGSQIFIHNQELKDITSINDVLKNITIIINRKVTKINKINLYWLCSYIWNQSMDNNLYIVGDSDINKFCQPCENYNIIIIIAACNLLGCTVPYYSASDTPGVKLTDAQIDECFNYKLCFGWIINYNRGHWVSLRRKHDEPDTVLYYNSTHESKKGIEKSLQQYKEEHKSEIYGILPIMYDGKNIVKDYIQELKPVKPVKPLTREDEILIHEIYKEHEEKEKSDALMKQILSKEQEQAPKLVKLKPQKSSSLTSNELDDILEEIEQQTKKEKQQQQKQEQQTKKEKQQKQEQQTKKEKQQKQEQQDEILAKNLQQELEDEILAKTLQQEEGCPMQKKYYRQYK
jgi:hypothetical protein